MRVLKPLFVWAALVVSAPSMAAVQFSAPTFTVSEAGITAKIKVVTEIADTANESVSVTYNTADGSAQVGAKDYEQATGSLIFATGETEKIFEITILEDDVVEQDESIRLTLTNPSRVALGPQSAVDLLIIDNDSRNAGSIEYVANRIAIGEGPSFPNQAARDAYDCNSPNRRTVPIAIRRTGGSFGEVTVNYTVIDGGTATLGTDYSTAPGTVTFLDGEVGPKNLESLDANGQPTFAFRVAEDCLAEGQETVIFELSRPTGGATIAGSQATIFINDDDPQVASPGSLAFVAATASVVEAQGLVRVRVGRTNGVDGAASVRYRINVSAPGNSGLADPSDLGVSSDNYEGVLEWANGDAGDRVISIPINNDSGVEPSETFTVTLNSPTGATLGASASATITIEDDDATSSGISFSTATQEVADDRDSVAILVRRSGSPSSLAGAASVNVSTSPVSATAPEDFTMTSQVVQWNAGEGGDKTVIIPINRTPGQNDAARESFLVTLSAANNAVINSPSQNQVTIVSTAGQAMPSTIAFESANYTASNGVASIRVLRTGSTSREAKVRVTSLDGSARAPDDYTAVDVMLTWAAGQADARVVQVRAAPIVEGSSEKRLSLLLSEPTGSSIGSTSEANVVIPAGAAQRASFAGFVSTSVTAVNGTALLRIARSGEGTGAASVVLRSFNGTATAGRDFFPLNELIQWEPGQRDVRFVEVSKLGNATDSRFFSVVLTEPNGISLTDATDDATVTFPGTPPTQVVRNSTIGLSVSSLKVLDNVGSIQVTVTRSGRADANTGAATVRLKTLSGSAVAGTHFTDVDQVLSWAANESGSKTAFIAINQLAAAGPDRSFSVTLQDVAGDATLTSGSETVVIQSKAAKDAKGVAGSMGLLVLIPLLAFGRRRIR